MRTSLKLTVLAAVILAALSVTAQGIRAQQAPDRLTIVVIDRYAISPGDANSRLVNTFLGLVASLEEGETLAFAFLDDLDTLYGPLQTAADGFAELQARVQNELGSGSASAPIDLPASLATIHRYISVMNVDDVSLYLVSASPEYTASDRTPAEIDAALAPIIQAGWNVFTVTTPGTNEALTSHLSGISLDTAGESFTLTLPDGFEKLADRALRIEGRGALSHVGRANLSNDPVFEVDLDIVPSTSRAKVLFIREDPQTSFRITNPQGVEASDGDRTASSITEFPHLVIWEVTDPVSGRWHAEVRDGSGVVSANLHMVNRFSIELQDLGAVPVGYPETLIVAAVLDKGQPVSPDDATFTVRITDPAGGSIVHELNDAALQGDAVSADGYFSATLPPVNSEGTYQVELRLSWTGLSHSLTSLAEFEAQNFPTIEVMPDAVEGLEQGEPAKVASVFININGQPFTALIEELTVSVSENNGAPAGEITKIPQEMITQGKAHAFDIYFTPNSQTRSTLVFGLDVEYAGRRYIYSTDSLGVSSLPLPAQAPTPPTAAVSQTPAPAPTAPPAPTAVPPPTTTEQPEESSMSIPIEAIIIALAVVGIAILGLILYWLTRPTPFGYMYAEEGPMLVDFAALTRRPLDKLMKRSRVDGDEIGVPGFEGVSFVFGPESVTMVSIRILPNTVRVNNQPVTDTMLIHDNSLIGAAGRLYIFRYLSQPHDENPE